MKIPTINTVMRRGEPIEFCSPDAAAAPAVLAYVRQLSTEAFRNLNRPRKVFEGSPTP